MSTAAKTAALALALAASVIACRADIPVGRLACEVDANCPDGWHCLPGADGKRCYPRAEGDGGDDGGRMRPDGGGRSDGGGGMRPDGGGRSDGGDGPCAVDNGGCDPLVTCTAQDDAAMCGDCPSGYDDTEGDGTRCVDIDECAVDNGGCGAASAWTCIDHDGAEPTCADVDECETSNGGCMQLCIDADGSFACACDPGYELEADAQSCHLPVWGTAARLETDDTGPALIPVVGVDAAGSAIAAWYQSGAGGYRVWANRYDASARAWQGPVAIQTSATNGYLVDVAVDAAGNAFAAWEQVAGSESNRTIVGARYVDGSWQAPEFIQSATTPGDAHEVQIATDGSGNAAAVWYESDGTRNNIWANRYDAGVGWGSPLLLETDNVGSANYQDVAIDAAGNAIAVWAQFDGTRYNAWASRSPLGGAWTAPVRIESDDTQPAWSPQIAFDAAGNAVVVWYQGDGDIWANRYVAGTGWGAAVQVERGSVSASEPKLAVNASGSAMAVWTQVDDTVNSAWASRFTVDGGWEEPVVLESEAGNVYLPHVALNDAGDAMATWDQNDGTRRNIWANRYVAGSGWTGAVLIEQNDAGDAIAGQVAIDAAGHAIAVWDQSDGVRSIWTNRFE